MAFGLPPFLLDRKDARKYVPSQALKAMDGKLLVLEEPDYDNCKRGALPLPIVRKTAHILSTVVLGSVVLCNSMKRTTALP